MDYNCLCINCMKEKPSQGARCPWCGYDPAAYHPDLDVLPPYSVLYGKYLIGRVLGRGGFGITYLGYNGMLDMVVAIKEFFPTGMIIRKTGTMSVSVSGGQNQGAFRAGLDSFIEEGRKLSHFTHIPGIVDVYDCFLENGTGYIVMEYLEGRSLKQFLQERGRLPYPEAKRIILEILRSLQVVHRENLIHRDIAPDNIFILDDGRVKLLDFGAARYAAMDRSQNLSVILKPGYAPFEQYSSNSNQGSWTDIYAVGATFYRMITGEKPPESTDRMIHDEIRWPSSYGISITRAEENVLMKGLALRAENRIRSAQEYIELLERADLIGVQPVEPIPEGDDGGGAGGSNTDKGGSGTQPDTPNRRHFLLAALFGAALVLLSGGIAGGVAVWKGERKKAETESETSEEDTSEQFLVDISAPLSQKTSEENTSEPLTSETPEEDTSEPLTSETPEEDTSEPLTSEISEEDTSEPVTAQSSGQVVSEEDSETGGFVLADGVDHTQYPIPGRKIRYKEGSLMTGDDVKYLQAILLELGYTGFELNGEYDQATNEAMMQFEEDHGLEPDGIVGSATLTALQEAVSDGDGTTADHTLYPAPSRTLEYDTGSMMVGNDVKYIQSILIELGYDEVEVNGKYDANTCNAVMQFEMEHGLEQTGMVTDETLEALQAAVSSAVTTETTADHTLYPVPERKLRYKEGDLMVGEDVKYVQAGLIELGFTGTGMTINGEFDLATKQAVQQFETWVGQESDGIVGEETLSALKSTLDGSAVG